MAYVDDYTAMLSGYYWYPEGEPHAKPVILTYSFVNEMAIGSYDPQNNPFLGALSTEQQGWVQSALNSWASASGIILIETKQHQGDLNFGFYDLPSATQAGDGSYPMSGAYVNANGSLGVYAGEVAGGIVRFDDATVDFSKDDFMHVALHEIGHALGLKHSFEEPFTLSPELDNTAHTVMSYTGYSPTLGSLDVPAIVAIYGDASQEAAYPFAWNWNATTETLTQIGTAASEYIKGTRANDYIDTAGGADAVVTYAGDDTIIAYGKSLQLNAGQGFDTLIENVSHSSVTFWDHGSSQGRYEAIYFGNEFQMLFGVERVQFTDGTVAFDFDGSAGQVYRLYQAAFDRVPDVEGLSYWIKHQDAGVSNLNDVADSFLHSPEFIQTYGTPETVTDSQYVDLLYTHTLGRNFDQNGFNYWVEKLDTNDTNRGDLLAFFSESDENVARVADAIHDGIWFV